MPVFTNILVAIDGSDAGQRAYVRAVEEAKVWNAKLHVIYVVETGLFSSLPADNTVEIMYRVLEKEGNSVLEQAKKYATEKGVTV
ncbi:MAG: universal stress protein, partial [Methanoregula sp.]|nr:universal stress protein [Methanoregula sp.]